MEPKGRPVYTRGPVVLILEIAQVCIGLIALGSLILTLFLFLSRTSEIQQSRYRAYIDTCYAIRSVALHAYGPTAQAEARYVLDQAGLGDCVGNARHIVKDPVHASLP